MAFRFDYYSGPNHFYGTHSPQSLVEKYGSPLYVYNEEILRQRCRDLKELVQYPDFSVTYSAKANANLTLLRIVCEEGLSVDAMSLGEIALEKAAGFTNDRIIFISNNDSEEELRTVLAMGITVSVDSLSQLELVGRIAPGSRVCARLNTGIGAGYVSNVVTGGHETKFAIDPGKYDDMKSILKKYDLKLVGLNQHIGSLFMDGTAYIRSVEELLKVCYRFPGLEFVDFGGGFGVPYHVMDKEKSLDLKSMGQRLDEIFNVFSKSYGPVQFKIESGRYISAECCILLGSVHAVKTVYENKYIGTDLGFNVLIRPVLYDAYHDLEIYNENREDTGKREIVSVVGNICESGDIIAKKREMPEMVEGDLVGVLNAGAYGYAMSSTYNQRFRPAEVMIRCDGTDRLIRRRDTVEDLLRNFEGI